MTLHRFVFSSGWTAPLTALQYETLCTMAELHSLPGRVVVFPAQDASSMLVQVEAELVVAIFPNGELH